MINLEDDFMLYLLGFCSIAFSLLGYIKTIVFPAKNKERFEVISFSLLLIGIIFFLGTCGISLPAVWASCCFIFYVAMVYQVLI